ncbi:helix-turn-helix domain-containing protein [Nocardioides sp. S-58]|uniref:Helix-turn-helix domain-containing protein n=1 Tax=Nocardioides renjunii TaxID=3095075 RepID=A0ABU5K994_9ACTN|nr:MULTISPECIES: helix-turn-helix domain-containing protein [unclassified Nocardioides]MDZ5661542.1 helix-turn-helix domain-containing protein [Nocardioides sp. S-58]WQQ22540.1 helix-turn-helix domain-containing protein [Nocardioides sp. S-34]
MNATDEPVLSEDELAVLRLMAEGQTVEAVARRLEVSERTVRRKARAVCATVGVDTPVEAIVWAVRRRLI